jgi:hypothetical protein
MAMEPMEASAETIKKMQKWIEFLVPFEWRHRERSRMTKRMRNRVVRHMTLWLNRLIKTDPHWHYMPFIGFEDERNLLTDQINTEKHKFHQLIRLLAFFGYEFLLGMSSVKPDKWLIKLLPCPPLEHRPTIQPNAPALI